MQREQECRRVLAQGRKIQDKQLTKVLGRSLQCWGRNDVDRSRTSCQSLSACSCLLGLSTLCHCHLRVLGCTATATAPNILNYSLTKTYA
jgi:hypothetical protein